MADINGNGKSNTLRGTNRDDDIYGRGGDDQLYGLGGDDDLEGGGGNDMLSGGGGDDDLEGGSGNDVLNGGTGRNDLEGGLGDDVFVFKKGNTDIDDFGLGNDTVQIGMNLGVDNFDELMEHASSIEGGEDVLFTFGEHTLRLEDTRLSELKESDFNFV